MIFKLKRLHEYKTSTNEFTLHHSTSSKIRSGYVPSTPITFIFGAKAAPAYIIAKDIIHAILCLQDIIAKDPVASKYIQVVMVENYNVINAENSFLLAISPNRFLLQVKKLVVLVI